MANMIVQTGIKEAELSAVVIRADGTREDLGVVGYYNQDEALAATKSNLSLLKRLFRKN